MHREENPGLLHLSLIGGLGASLSNEMPALSLSPQGSQLPGSSCLTAVTQTTTLKTVVGDQAPVGGTGLGRF